MKRLWLVLAGAALLIMACSFSTSFGNGGGSAGSSTSTAAPPSATVAPPTAAAPAGGKVLFRDDFSDPNSGWDRVKDDTGSLTDYVDSHYRIFVNDDNTDIWANPGKNFDGDVVVAVDAVRNSGPLDNDFGVICRYQDKQNYYFFVISSDGYAGIGKVFQGEQTLLNKDAQMVPMPQVPKGKNVTYHIKASCIGNALTLTVNGKRVMTVHDDSLAATGDGGLMAGTFDKKGTDILFDNFVVRRP